MDPRKLLLVVFADDACRQNHALLYALDLHARGHRVKLLLEGRATRMLQALGAPDSRTGALLREAIGAGLVAGACARAAAGCDDDDPARRVTGLAAEAGVALDAGLRGHASIAPYVSEGYEVVIV